MRDFLNKLLSSSKDPKQLSLTVRSQLLLIAPLFALILRSMGHAIPDGDIQTIVDNISDLVFLVASAVWAAMSLYGMFRRLWVTIHTNK